VTTPSVETDGNPEESARLPSGSGTLWAEFAQRVLSEGQSGAVDGPTRVDSGGDWDSIRQAGEGAPSDEAAIGKVVRAASLAARGNATRQVESTSPPELNHAANGAIVSYGGQPSVSPGLGAEGAIAQKPIIPPSGSNTPNDTLQRLNAPEATPADGFERDAGPIGGNAIAAVVFEPLPVEQSQGSPTSQVDVVPPDHVPIVPLAPESENEETTGDEPRTVLASTSRRSAWFHTFTWIRNIGIIVLLFVAWQLWGTSISQHHAQSQLKSEFDAKVEAHHAASGHPASLIPAAPQLPSPPQGSVVAQIQVPAIGVDQYVVEGTTESDLSKGPGHYIGTAMPGQAGNVAIAGHRTTNGAPFNGLGHLVPGDRIILNTTSGQHLTYVVSGTPQVVSPRDVNVLNYVGDNRVTLTTCNPEFSSSQRLVVVGELKEPPGGPTVDAKHVEYHVADPATASWNWSLLPGLGVVVCLLLLLALSNRFLRKWFRGFTVWLVLVPIWAAGLYLLFDTLTRFLPASF
jgi:sortase A